MRQRVDLDPAGEAPARGPRDPLDERGPHVQLDLLGHAQVVVEQVREAVAAAGPRLDLEAQPPSGAGSGAELDLARLEMAGERREAERARRDRRRRARGRPTARASARRTRRRRASPRPARDLLEDGELGRGDRVEVRARSARSGPRRRRSALADARRRSGGGRAGPTPSAAGWISSRLDPRAAAGAGRRRAPPLVLAPVHRRRAPHVAPTRQRDADRPAGGGREAAGERRAARHGGRAYPAARAITHCRGRGPGTSARMLTKALHRRRPARLAAARRLARLDRPVHRPLDPREDRRPGRARQRRAPRAVRRPLAADVLAHRRRRPGARARPGTAAGAARAACGTAGSVMTRRAPLRR